MVTNLNGKYASAGEAVIFSDGRFNYQQDNRESAAKRTRDSRGSFCCSAADG